MPNFRTGGKIAREVRVSNMAKTNRVDNTISKTRAANTTSKTMATSMAREINMVIIINATSKTTAG
jgi:hypothetical protein